MDHQSFVQKIQEMRGQLYRTAYGYLGNPHESMDAVDEAVFQAYRAWKQLRNEEHFKTWMTRILIHVCYKELRRRKIETVVEDFPEKQEEEFDSLPVREAVRRLPEELRRVIVLRYFTGLTLSETAATLEIPQGTVATRQRRALSLLKIELKEEDL